MANAVTEAAKQAIGEGKRNDWVLKLEAHSPELPPEASVLRRVLERPEIQAIIRRYLDADARALAAQSRYRRAGRIGIWMRLVAVTIGAAALVMASQLPPPIPTVCALLQASALAVAYLAVFWMRWRRSFLKWMTARGEAELARIAFFDAVTAVDEPARGGAIPLAPLQLEYFRRYQLDVQKAFYTGRGGEQRAEVKRMSIAKYVLFAIVALAAAALVYELGVTETIYDWSQSNPQRLVIALLTVVSAIQSAFTDASLMELKERNAARYAATVAKLREIEAAALEPARAAAAEGRTADVRNFCKSINDELSAEHRAWTALLKEAPRPEKELLRKEQWLNLPGSQT